MKGLTPKLAGDLTRLLGSRQAQLELGWMRQTFSTPPTGEHLPTLSTMVERRLLGEPLQYILGTQPFGHLDLLVKRPVLIPRPETEDWTTRLAAAFKPSTDRPLKLLDLCTGSGCIPLLLCHLWPTGSLRAVGVDISDDAIKLARDNAERVGIPPRDIEQQQLSSAENTFTVLRASILEEKEILGKLQNFGHAPFDIVTSNPPYIPQHEYDILPSSVREYEDERALLGDPPHLKDGDQRGLTFYRAIADLVATGNLVKEGGLVICEVGHGQSKDVAELMQLNARLRRTEIWKDPWDIERVVLAWK